MSIIFKYPVLLVSVFIVSMFIIDITGIGYEIKLPGDYILSIATFMIGILIIATGGYTFKRVNTTLNPSTPEKTTQLVTTGIYNYSRNPMYVGFFTWLVAVIILIGNMINLLLLPLYILLVNKLYILPEESALEKLFPDSFLEYKKTVRRWL